MTDYSMIGRTILGSMIIYMLCTACGSLHTQEMVNQAQYHHDLAYGHFFENQDGDAALQEILISLKLNETSAQSHWLAGLIFSGRGASLTAIKHYRRALEIDPTLHEVQNNLGTIYLSLEQWEKAVEVFKPLTKTVEYRTPAMSHNNLGWAYFKLGRYEEARQQLLASTQLDPRLCPPYNNLGILYLKLNDKLRAQRILQRGIKRCPTYAEPNLHLAHAILYSAQPIAEEALRRCISLAADTDLGLRCEQLLISIQGRANPNRSAP